MKALKSVDEHRSIRLIQNVRSNLDDQVRPYPEKISIERGMVQFAQCESVRDERLSKRIGVGDYVCGVQQFVVAKATKRTSPLIRLEYSEPKRNLMQSMTRRHGDVLAARVFNPLSDSRYGSSDVPGVIELNTKT